MGGGSSGEQALEERYQSLLVQAPTPICITRGPAHRIELANAAYLALLGRPDSVGKSFREAHEDFDAEYYFQVMDRVYRTGERFVATEAVIRARNDTPSAAGERYFNIVYEPLRDRFAVVDGLMIFAVEVTGHVQGRRALEDAQRRSQFLVEASATLSESLDYQRTLRRVAELAVPSIADWCTVTAVDERGDFRRIAVVHHDAAKADLVAEYEARFPPGDHRSGQLVDVLKRRTATLSAVVTDADLVSAAQSEEHLRILRGLGCTSCIMVPMIMRGEAVGIISLMRADARRPYDKPDVALAEELAHRAAMAVDSARLYREARNREQTMRFFAEASAVLSGSLDSEAICQRLARLVVPSLADWCAVDVEEQGKLRQVAVAHVDPSKVEFARELNRRYPPDPEAPTGSHNVVRTGKAELYEDIPDELLVKVSRDEEHLRMARKLGLRSALVVPLVASGRPLGALTLVWAESGRRYNQSDVNIMEELGRRAGLAVENARLYRETKAAVTLRDEFLTIASHELKTPLTSLQLQITGMGRTLARSEEVDVAKLASRIEFVDKQLDRLTKLVDGLLDVSRAAAGRLTLSLEPVDLVQVVGEVAERFKEDLSRAGSVLSVRLDGSPDGSPDGSIIGRWDRLRLDEIVTNLLGNAIKYGQGKPIEIAAFASATTATLIVRDHGIGISAEDQKRIFQRFARAVSAEHYGGFGLGLWIVKALVDLMNGSVHVESGLDGGSLFTIALPLQAKVQAQVER